MSLRTKAASTENLAELEPLLGELVAATTAAAAQHAAPDRLLAYHAGQLTAAEEAVVQAHLAACPACAAALLDLDAFTTAAAAPSGGQPTDLATTTAWRAFAPRLGEAREPASRRRTARWSRLLAAALMLVVPALVLLLARSQQRLDELRRALGTPQTGVPMLYLDSVTRDNGLEALTLDLPPGEGFFLLAITPSWAADEGRFRVEIADQAGKRVWRRENVAASDHGTLRLGFTRRSLPPGRYRLEVWTEGSADPGAVFSFLLRDPA